MDPSHHHMTSEYTHGHEYDTYHYEDQTHHPLHFTVTRPEDYDIPLKGAYYHAHPMDVSPSFGHHTAHIYAPEVGVTTGVTTEVERVPVHQTIDHHYIEAHEAPIIHEAPVIAHKVDHYGAHGYYGEGYVSTPHPYLHETDDWDYPHRHPYRHFYDNEEPTEETNE